MKRINILSTRSIKWSLIEQAGRAGILIDQIEFIKTKPIISPEKIALIQNLPAYASLVFTSTNAVEAFSQLVHDHNINPGQHRVFCVDGRTNDSINALFPSFVIAARSETARALALEILNHDIEKIYFICGNLRRDELPDILRQKGIAVEELELYKTEPTPIKIEQNYDGLIFFSPSAVSSFFSVNKIPADTTCFAIGETTANAIKVFSDNGIVVATKPRQENIISTIINHYQS